ncbi:MAG: 1,4-alpha-glucan branching protein GlgB [Lachnospiraceae bacterium]|nr:1,4-alpha-glucan branching protein GlgB [Lachnospiraceae bacterium]
MFHQGTNYEAYEYLGVHRERKKIVFRTWAPNAAAVFVSGDFNSWDDSLPMTKISENGIYEASLPEESFPVGSLYKFRILTGDGRVLYKADPYGFFCQTPPETASVYYPLKGYRWHDKKWMETRRERSGYSSPVNIYEMHLGSWKRHPDGSYLTYSEIADELIPYLKTMGYTHVEFLPVMEHPFDGSWGYQVTGYFAPTARYGEPKDFMALVDRLHVAGIAVILDWVPAHFPKDAHGLYEFDGKPLYEYQGADRIEHRGWGTRKFDLGRNEVECFLISSAVFWAKYYHADGLRVDAVASMLYLDYDKKPGEWIPNVYGDNRCLEAEAFLKKLNSCMKTECPDVLMIAEESTSGFKVTGFSDHGLGFDMKWNMGWMNDTLSYAGLDPLFRKYHHDKLTFPMMYAYSERYLLPISHDEVVHGKKTLLDRMPGEYFDKFAGERLFLAYQIACPGKKLLFMGQEIGQFREWDEKLEVEWFLLDYESHARMQQYVASVNRFYRTERALYENDGGWEGFSWVSVDDCNESVIAFRRISENGEELVAAFNFTPVLRDGYPLVLPEGEYEEVFSTDEIRFGGRGTRNPEKLVSVPGEPVRVVLPPLSAVFFRRTVPKKNKGSAGKLSDPALSRKQ